MADNMNQDVIQMDTDGASAAHSSDTVPMQERAFSQLDDRVCSRASIHFVADLNRQPDTKNSIVMNSVAKAPGMAASNLPRAGSRVSRKTIKKAGPYILGPVVGPQPVHSIVQCLARHEVTKKCYTLKILTLKDSLDQETEDDRQGKMLMHAEHSILGLLEHEQGVINKHEFFKDYAIDEKVVESKRRKKRVYTGKIKQRLCLVLDCLINHDFNLDSENFINLQDYVISQKKLSEKETLVIFYDTVRTVAAFHAKHVIHRDLKLGNLVYNIRQKKTIITNFCLGEHKSATTDLLYDQRGSPAYIAPEVLSGKHYAGKPADMWALGVMLYTMLYGQFPFYENTPSELFNQIKSVSYVIPEDSRVSDLTKRIIKNLLALQPQKRLTATQLLNSLESVIALYIVPDTVDDKSRGEQVVPQCNTRYLNSNKAELNALCNTPAAAAKMAQIEALLGSIRGENLFTRYVSMQEAMEAQMMGRGPSLDENTNLPLVMRRFDTQLSNFSPAEYRRLIQRDNQLSEDSSTNSEPSEDDARDDVSMDEIDNEDGQDGPVSYLSVSGAADRNRHSVFSRLYQLQNHPFSVNANENNTTISQSAQGSLPDQRRTTGGSFSPVNYETMNRGNADNSCMYLALRNRLHNALTQSNVSESSRALLNMIFFGSTQGRLIRNAHQQQQQREHQSFRVRNALHEMLSPYARRRSLWLSRRSASNRFPNPPHHPQSPLSHNQRAPVNNNNNNNNNSERGSNVNNNSNSSSMDNNNRNRRVNPSMSDVLVPEQQQQDNNRTSTTRQVRCPENSNSSNTATTMQILGSNNNGSSTLTRHACLRRLAREVIMSNNVNGDALLDSEFRHLLSVRLAAALATTTNTHANTDSPSGNNSTELNGVSNDRANVNDVDYG